ncbi:hypothetical protein J2Z32_004302, partial [Paenibacillus turicensis]|nr:hypothetical protein [Paenibacillus turicensis]
DILLLLDTIKTPIMVEVEFLFFLLSTMMGAYQTLSSNLFFIIVILKQSYLYSPALAAEHEPCV